MFLFVGQFRRIVVLFLSLFLFLASGMPAAADHGQPGNDYTDCYILYYSIPKASNFYADSTASPAGNFGWCYFTTAEVVIAVETSHGFTRDVTFTAGSIYITWNYRIYSDHTYVDTREKIVGACYNPEGVALPTSAVERNPNCALPA